MDRNLSPSMRSSSHPPEQSERKKRWWNDLTFGKCKKVFFRHLYFVGPGLVSSVAYIDPGNWATDLEAGANYGYKLLFVVLVASLAAVVLQLLSVRLGTATGISLPAQTRLLFLRLKARYPKYRIPLSIALWALYALAEIAIIATDLAELLGSAIALHLLFPKLPLFAGVLITAVDVLIVLIFFRSSSGRQGMLLFEIIIVSLTLVKPGALYLGVGIIGATVMPHALFLGSFLAGVDRLNMIPQPPIMRKPRNVTMPSFNPFRRTRSVCSDSEQGDDANSGISPVLLQTPRPHSGSETAVLENDAAKDEIIPQDSILELTKEQKRFAIEQKEYERNVRMFDRIKWVDIHLFHSTIDTAFSLLSFALTINSSILTLAGAVYFYNERPPSDEADLFGAFDLIKSYIGHAAAIIFALALLCAGQSASITATLAGQVVSEGFINWKTSPLVRRLITRLLGVIPSAVVASAVGPSGLNTMLVASQVLLSIVLPTVVFPLVYLCSQHDIMTVQGPEVESMEMESVSNHASLSGPSALATTTTSLSPTTLGDDRMTLGIEGTTVRVEPDQAGDRLPRRSKSYVSPKWVTVLGYVLFVVIVLANVYVIVELGLGNG
ncbi:metal iron transporter [Cryptococcus deuterogattii 2001/935-1]|nr:metal iron transporter [Cryptococcus deuterogattii 2001/935-1]